MNVPDLRAAIGLLIAAMVAMVIPVGGEASSDLVQQCPEAAAWLNARTERAHAQHRALEAIRPSKPALAKQLAQRAARDQAVRSTVINSSTGSRSKALKSMNAVDQANLAWFKPHVEAHGFPTLKQVGFKGVENAWLLVQHADRDPAFQAQVLAELKPRLKNESFLRPDFAMLTDRVRLNYLHKKQIYGTQFAIKKLRLVMRPTEAPKEIDRRRASMDLMPLSDYRCGMQATYHMPAQIPENSKDASARH